MTRGVITLVVSFITDFLITAGSTIQGAMLATGSTEMPIKAVWVLAGIVGAISASRRVQAYLSISPLPAPVPPAKTPALEP